jgi:hypothetical protein
MHNLLIRAIQDAALPTLLTFLLVGALAGLVVGVWLTAWPMQFFQLTSGLNRWTSARRALKIWETPLHWERFFYRHHRAFGLMILLATGWTLYYFIRLYSPEQVLRFWRRASGISPAWAPLLAGTVWIIRIASVLAMLIGLVVLIRPSLLKHFEAKSNTWVSTRKMMRPLEQSYPVADSFANRHPRIAGLIIIAVSCYALISLMLMFAGTIKHF